jgi:hypothetical protein
VVPSRPTSAIQPSLAIIEGEAWAVDASRKASRQADTHVVLVKDPRGSVTQYSKTSGQISEYNGESCMVLYTASTEMTNRENFTPYVCVIPRAGLGEVVTEEISGGGPQWWSITTLRNDRGTLGQVESSEGA